MCVTVHIPRPSLAYSRSGNQGADIGTLTAGQPKRWVLYGVTFGLFIYGWLSANIYLPVLPELERIFQSTTQTAKLTVVVYLVGYSTTQLFWGPLSDRFGRRPVLLTGLAIGVLGAALASVSTDMYQFIGARFLESIGLGVASVLARSILTDTLDLPHIAIAMAYVVIAVAAVPAVAPIAGGYLDLLLSWRGIFYFLVLYGAILLAVCFFRLPETNKEKNTELTATDVFAEYVEILSDRKYLGYTVSYFISYGTLFGYYATAPFIFIKILDYSPHEYGYLLIVNVAVLILGAGAARVLVPKLGSERTIIIAIVIWIGAVVLFGILDAFTTIGTVSVLLPICIVLFGSGMVSPAANAGAMNLFRDRAGASTAIVGCAAAGGGAIFNAGLSNFNITTLGQLGIYVGLSTLLLVGTYWVFLRGQSKPNAET